MMSGNRMSPLTAFFIGLFGVGAVGIVTGAGVVLYGMDIVNTNAKRVLGLADNALDGLPELIESLPPAVAELLNDRREPGYAGNIDLQVRFAAHDHRKGLRPVLSITNHGDQVVSMLAVRVAALNKDNLPVEEWTEVVATPIAVDGNWRGPLFPGSVRHVMMSGWGSVPASMAGSISSAVEVSELRVWHPNGERLASAD